MSYVRELMKKNFFRIKTGFYEDEDPKKIIESLVFQINESKKRKVLINEGFFDVITNFFKTDDQSDDNVGDGYGSIPSRYAGPDQACGNDDAGRY